MSLYTGENSPIKPNQIYKIVFDSDFVSKMESETINTGGGFDYRFHWRKLLEGEMADKYLVIELCKSEGHTYMCLVDFLYLPPLETINEFVAKYDLNITVKDKIDSSFWFVMFQYLLKASDPIDF